MTKALSVLIALAPSAYVWYTGRRLLGRIDEPAFPELRFASGQRAAMVFIASVVGAAVLSPSLGFLLFVLAALAALATNYPTRKAIFEESWGLTGYLGHALRFWVGLLGAWFLLAFTPAIAETAGAAAVPVSVGIVALVYVWSRANAVIFPRIIGAQPLDRPGLAERFDAILERARCRRPRIFEAGAPGGRWVNGLAVPAARRSSVVLTTGLLDELTPGESGAIFAHEMAHLEYFERRGRMLRREALSALLCGGLIGLVVWLGPGSSSFEFLTWAWPLLLLLAMLRSMAGSQAREHESDVRAVELVGDVEVVASALTKIHNAMRMPRRWDASREHGHSHPSLARRLRAIRESVSQGGPAAEGRVESGSEALLVRDAERPGEAVLLDRERLHWLTGLSGEDIEDAASAWEQASESRVIRYADLSDLRLEIRRGRCHLTAVDARGARSRLLLAPADVAPVKAVLERTDRQVGDTSPARVAERSRRTQRARRIRLWAILTAIVALLPPFSFPLAVVAGLAIWRPEFVTLLALGVMGLSAAILQGVSGQLSTAALTLGAGVAVIALIEAFLWRRNGIPEAGTPGRVTLVALAGLALVYALQGASRLVGPLPAMQLHLWARYELGLTVVALTGAVTAWSLRRRWARAASAAAAVAALALLVVGSGWFARAFGGDPMSEPGRVSRSELLSPEIVRQIEIDEPVVGLRISPSGGRVAARLAYYGGATSGGGTPFRVEAGPDSFLRLDAVDLAFLSDDEVAYLSSRADEALVLVSRRLGTGDSPDWRIELPALPDPRLSVDAAARTWEVSGHAPQEGSAIRLSGRFERSDYARSEWRVEPDQNQYLMSLHVGHGPRAVAVVNQLPPTLAGGLTALLLPFGLYGYPTGGEIWSVEGDDSRSLARTSTPLTCTEPAARSARFVCYSFGAAPLLRVWGVDAETGAIENAAVLPSGYYDVIPGPRDRALVWAWNRPPLLLALSSGRVWTLDAAPSDGEEIAGIQFGALGWLGRALLGTPSSATVYEAAALGEVTLALATRSEAGTRIAVLRLDD